MIFNMCGFVNEGALLPKFSYDGNCTLADEGKTGTTRNWNLSFFNGGIFVPSRDITVDLFILGAGGAGNKDGLGGGGGYYKTINNITLTKNTSYSITIGTGGDTNGEAGGSSSAFGYTANGGSGGTAGSLLYATCTVDGYSGGHNIYYYSYFGDNNPVSKGYSQIQVNLAYPLEEITNFVVSGQNVKHIYAAYPEGYYRCSIISIDSNSGSSGETGAGAAATRVFGSGNTVSGAGAGAGAANATIPGAGGAGNGAYGGTTFGRGGNGLVIIRNAR